MVRLWKAAALDLNREARLHEQPLRRLQREGQVEHDKWRLHEQVAQVRDHVVAATEEPRPRERPWHWEGHKREEAPRPQRPEDAREEPPLLALRDVAERPEAGGHVERRLEA